MPALSSVASSWLKTRNSRVLMPRALRQPQRQPGDGALGLQRQDVQPLLLELVAQPRLAVGDVDAFDDLAVRRGEPAAELHAQRSNVCKDHDWHANYINIGTIALNGLDRAAAAKGWVGVARSC